MLEDILITLFLGMIGTFILGFGGVLIYFICSDPKVIAYVVGALTVFLSVGWCISHFEDFRALFRKEDLSENKPPEPLPCPYGNPILDGLRKFELKYRMATTLFMSFVYNNQIPYGMDNLDYLEWIALVNELPSITNEKRKGK